MNHEAIADKTNALQAAIVAQIPVTLQVVLGSAKISISELQSLAKGSVVRLDRRVGAPVDILVNGAPIGQGEIAVVEGDEPRFAISLTALVGEQGAAPGR